jgi:acyl-CoA reductase-like NAD-dependent aldehyde dehydrogenase
MPDDFGRVRAAAIDERLHNVYHRQVQLEQLCGALIENAKKLSHAIETDYGHSAAEIAVELNLAIGTIRRDYATLEPKKAHEEEYLLATGKDAPASTRPVGIAYIEPCTHTMLYSVVAPLSAAVAAGNCVILLVHFDIVLHADPRTDLSCSLRIT